LTEKNHYFLAMYLMGSKLELVVPFHHYDRYILNVKMESKHNFMTICALRNISKHSLFLMI